MTRKRKQVAVARGLPAIADMTRPQKIALLAMDGNAGNGSVAAQFHRATWGEVDPWACGDALRRQVEQMQRGDMSEVEASLYGQASALGAIFQGLAQRSAANMGENIETADRYMRLALKAQSQCRATLETLAEIKNPRSVAFVRQANIAAGHQQINNADTPPLRAETIQCERNELQEAPNEQPLVIGEETQGIGTDPRAATVVAIDGSTNKGRER